MQVAATIRDQVSPGAEGSLWIVGHQRYSKAVHSESEKIWKAHLPIQPPREWIKPGTVRDRIGFEVRIKFVRQDRLADPESLVIMQAYVQTALVVEQARRFSRTASILVLRSPELLDLLQHCIWPASLRLV